jgi:hypothetical protein
MVDLIFRYCFSGRTTGSKKKYKKYDLSVHVLKIIKTGVIVLLQTDKIKDISTNHKTINNEYAP